MEGIEYNKLGKIVSITPKIWHDTGIEDDMIERFDITFDSGKKLILSYATECRDLSMFYYSTSSLIDSESEDFDEFDIDWDFLFVGRTIESITDKAMSYLKNKEEVDINKRYETDQFYEIKFTDGKKVTIRLFCYSNNLERSLVTEIQ